MIKTKLIIRAPTDDIKDLKKLKETLEDGEIVVISEDAKILIKDKEGYWKETGKKKWKFGDIEFEN